MSSSRAKDGDFLRKSLKMLGFLALLLFFTTSIELHADDDVADATEAHCSVTCCPSHHLGPRISAILSLKNRASLDRSFEREERDDPSIEVPLSVFHPPKALRA
jgi:hypothetical protein